LHAYTRAFCDTRSGEKVDYWNRYLYASRETAELRAEDKALGLALARLLRELAVPEAEQIGINIKSLFVMPLYLLLPLYIGRLSLEETAQGLFMELVRKSSGCCG
jgi:urease accessory protein